MLAVLVLLTAVAGCRRARPSDELFAVSTAASPLPKTVSLASFVDIAARAGVRFVHYNGANGDFRLPETMGSGCAFIDFDGDGWLDLFFVNSKSVPMGVHSQPKTDNRKSTLALYRNNRDGTFTDVTAGSGLDVTLYGMGCAIADYDNDGRDDILVTTVLAGHRLFRNEGNGKFKDVTPDIFRRNPKWSTSAAWVDYDNDGRLDLFVCNYTKYNWRDDELCIHAEGYLAYCSPRYFPPQACSLYRNDGDGKFTDVTERAGIGSATGKSLGVCVLDYDDDGWPDIAVASDTTRNLLFHNVRNGKFEEVGLAQGLAFTEDGRTRAGMGIDAADLRNEGRLSLLISNFSAEGLSLFHQDAPKSGFTDVSHAAGVWAPSYDFLGFGLFFFDMDNDGLPDAFVTNGHVQPKVGEYSPNIKYAERKQLFHNLGDGRFEEVGKTAGEAFTRERVGRGAACGDFDNDGHLDIIISNNNQPAQLLRNLNSNGNWIQFELRGTTGNRNAIGAKVALTAGGNTQTQWVHSGSSYCSQSMLRLHFGLGGATKIERLVVRWPGGKPEEVSLNGVQVNRLYSIREGARRAEPASFQ